jgi:hypothetical protein
MNEQELRRRIEILEELMELKLPPPPLPSGQNVECFNILNFGALASPNDIGPAVQAAINAAIAQGHKVMIERGDTAWGIAKKITGDGLRFAELVTANPTKQTAPPGFSLRGGGFSAARRALSWDQLRASIGSGGFGGAAYDPPSFSAFYPEV